jgi:hypothetical protein
VKIAGEDVAEEDYMSEGDLSLDAVAGYDDETKALFARGLGDDPGPPLLTLRIQDNDSLKREDFFPRAGYAVGSRGYPRGTANIGNSIA